MPEADSYTNPFFWALMSMFGMVGATSLFSKHALRRSRLFVAIVLILITAGRIVLVLPFCEQPRFEFGEWRWVGGGAIIAVGLLMVAGPTFLGRRSARGYSRGFHSEVSASGIEASAGHLSSRPGQASWGWPGSATP